MRVLYLLEPFKLNDFIKVYVNTIQYYFTLSLMEDENRETRSQQALFYISNAR